MGGAGHRSPPVGDLSSRQLANHDLPRFLRSQLERFHAEPSRLELEITEAPFLDDAATTIQMLQRLRHVGVRIVIDDFGRGLAPIAAFTRLPIDGVKIDPDWVQRIDADPQVREVVRATIALARALELDVVAEGVDRTELVDTLRELGCQAGHGYAFGRALPAERFDVERSHPVPVAERSAPAPRGDALIPTGPPESAYCLVVDGESGSLGLDALQLTRIGFLVLYTRFVDEAALLAEQEEGNIRVVIVSPRRRSTRSGRSSPASSRRRVARPRSSSAGCRTTRNARRCESSVRGGGCAATIPMRISASS